MFLLFLPAVKLKAKALFVDVQAPFRQTAFVQPYTRHGKSGVKIRVPPGVHLWLESSRCAVISPCANKGWKSSRACIATSELVAHPLPWGGGVQEILGWPHST